MDIITKDTTMKEAKEILDRHDCPLGRGWEIILGMLLRECDYLEVHGQARKAYFVKRQEASHGNDKNIR